MVRSGVLGWMMGRMPFQTRIRMFQSQSLSRASVRSLQSACEINQTRMRSFHTNWLVDQSLLRQNVPLNDCPSNSGTAECKVSAHETLTHTQSQRSRKRILRLCPSSSHRSLKMCRQVPGLAGQQYEISSNANLERPVLKRRRSNWQAYVKRSWRNQKIV